MGSGQPVACAVRVSVLPAMMARALLMCSVGILRGCAMTDKTSSNRPNPPRDPDAERLDRLAKEISSKLGTPAYEAEKDELVRKMEDYIEGRPGRRRPSTGSS